MNAGSGVNHLAPWDPALVTITNSAGVAAEAMAAADYILLCLALTAASKGLLGRIAFAAIQPSAALVDLSWGGIVVHDQMIAVLDVFPVEPLPHDDLLWRREGVLISPHCSGVCEGWEARSVEMFADNLERWLESKRLVNMVDPTKEY